MKKQGKILIVDDNRNILCALQMLLGSYFEQVLTLPSPVRLLSVLREEKVDVVLLDMNFNTGINTGNEGLYWLGQIKEFDKSLPVVLFTAYADIELAVRGIKEGATDFIVKPWENEKMVAVLLAATSSRKDKTTRKSAVDEAASEMYWGESPVMKALRSLTQRVAQTNADILITGENGTGKEVLAKEIHDQSLRSRGTMVCVDLGAIPDTLFESELFGCVKGAFTDAKSDRMGKFEAANGGTLFLDEIGNLPFHLQAKLLSVLQRRTIFRVGSTLPIPIDIRLICATNRNLHQMVAQGEFREDLLYRINTVHVELPPLRERTDEIVPLAKRFIGIYEKQYKAKESSLSKEAEEILKACSWQGNIRELRHCIERAIILTGGGILAPNNFVLSESKAIPISEAPTLDEMEQAIIRKAMTTHNGNLSAVAAQLGITRQTLYNKLKKYTI
ncbi:MAG: sigma-54 dependent transcriptional regulator [Bacteroidales bacterium]|nr:sigma-54 dependent transcriptional regulator [Bacteroidales bacterium]